MSLCSYAQNKINGVSFVASPYPIDTSHMRQVEKANANWVAIMPFGFMPSLNAPEIQYDVSGQWWGERIEGARQTIRIAHQQGLRVMLKPQLWIRHGAFTGDISMTTEIDWQQLERSYQEFILAFAKLAQEENVRLFCIGTELHSFVNQRSKFWENLVTKVKKIYSGQLTYAENWDKISDVCFWDKLDYIGVDAYFPISRDKTPTVAQSKTGWKNHVPLLKGLSTTYQTPVLFTEYGYRSVDYAGKEPWNSSRNYGQVNLEAQENLLTGLFKSVWDQPWFTGGFLWKWYAKYEGSGGPDDNRFTPQNKPALQTIARFYQNTE